MKFQYHLSSATAALLASGLLLWLNTTPRTKLVPKFSEMHLAELYARQEYGWPVTMYMSEKPADLVGVVRNDGSIVQIQRIPRQTAADNKFWDGTGVLLNGLVFVLIICVLLVVFEKWVMKFREQTRMALP